MTGHLVFTTVHANNVVDVLGRFLNMGVEPYNFVSALNCILAQRLVRTICWPLGFVGKNSLSRQELMERRPRYQAALANERGLAAKKQQILARQQQARSQQDSAQTYLSYSRLSLPWTAL